jgi:alpha-glucosidase
MADHLWWQTGIVYQIYPRSFMDSNGDGTGDLNGVTSRMDYLEWLGIDALWLSPIFPSPMADFGYDVANYVDVDPLFGTLADFDRLLQAAHQRNIKVLLDLVPNHSSDEHAWFVESRSSRDNPKRDWYIWRDPAPDGGPPNNWQSFFGGDAWTFDKATGQYYLHLFHAKQPDLNWRNSLVRDGIYSAMRFWFDRGVDGFRIDVIWLLMKDEQFRDNPLNPNWKEGDPPFAKHDNVYTGDLPEVHEIVREMRAITDQYHERVLIGEIYLPVPRLMMYYGQASDEAHLPFNFQLIQLPWNAQVVREAVDTYEAALPNGGWPNWVLGNHDQHRVASRVGREQARVAQMLLLTLRGTPTSYYGDEIGMQNVNVPVHLIQDPQGKYSPAHTRDPERSPMQWDASPNAGFTTPEATPWLPIADDYSTFNVAAEREDATSMLLLYRRLVELRRTMPALSVGSYRSVDARSDEVFAYVREHGPQRVLIVLNFGSTTQNLDFSSLSTSGQLLCTTNMDSDGNHNLGYLTVRPNEGMVIAI